MKNNKGFTMIELLAVIIILGILMLVGIPAISKTIFNSRKDAAETSVKRYVGEVNNGIKLLQLDEKDVEDGTYPIMKNGDVCLSSYDASSNACSGKFIDIDMEGQIPESGEVEIENYRVVNVNNVKVDNFYINNGGSGSGYVASNEPVEVTPAKPVICFTSNSDQYSIGALYTCEVAPGLKYEFRILSVNGNSYNLMMVRDLEGIRSNWGGTVYNNSCGPVGVYNTLSSATSGWSNLSDVTFKQEVGNITIDFNAKNRSWKVSSTNEGCVPGVYTTMKARAASNYEIEAVPGPDFWYQKETYWYDRQGSGYWLNEPFSLPGEEYCCARTVGAPHGGADEVGYEYGVRPVIQVAKEQLAKSA